MNKPKDCLSYPFFVLDECLKKDMWGDYVLMHFFDWGIWKENHIPKELQEKNWKPQEDKLYKVWFTHTCPPDPCDPGYYVLDYIEEYETIRKGKTHHRR